jgi:hypothetical protein
MKRVTTNTSMVVRTGFWGNKKRRDSAFFYCPSIGDCRLLQYIVIFFLFSTEFVEVFLMLAF